MLVGFFGLLALPAPGLGGDATPAPAPRAAARSAASTAPGLLEAPLPVPWPELRRRVLPLATPVPIERSPTLTRRPLVLDFRDHSFALRYTTRRDERLEPVASPGLPPLLFDVQTARRELSLDYRRRLGSRLELGVRAPFVELEETRPPRILPAVGAPFFTTTADERIDSGLGDAVVSLAHASNGPRYSRRAEVSFKTDTGDSRITGPRSLPLGSGQTDLTLAYGIKRLDDELALALTAGAVLRGDGDRPLAPGGAVNVDPGDELFVELRADRRITDWWTASLLVAGRFSERDAVSGATVPGTARELVTVGPVLTYQASRELEVIADVELPVVAEGLPDTALFGVALRWRK